MQRNRPLRTHDIVRSPAPKPNNDLFGSYFRVFTTPDGQKILNDLAWQANSPSINNESIDPYVAVWLAARRNMFDYVMKCIDDSKTKSVSESEE